MLNQKLSLKVSRGKRNESDTVFDANGLNCWLNNELLCLILLICLKGIMFHATVTMVMEV